MMQGDLRYSLVYVVLSINHIQKHNFSLCTYVIMACDSLDFIVLRRSLVHRTRKLYFVQRTLKKDLSKIRQCRRG